MPGGIVGSDRPEFAPARFSFLLVLFAATALAGIPRDAHARVSRRGFESTGGAGFEYVSPLPGSNRVSPYNNIVLRQGSEIDGASLARAVLSVAGAASGDHDGRLVLSDDARTIVFRPTRAFAPGEEVEVALESGIRTRNGDDLPPLAFHFTVAEVDPRMPRDPAIAAALSESAGAGDAPDAGLPGAATPAAASAACGLPASYPPITLLASDHPEPGCVFLSPFRSVQAGHLVIVDDLAQPLFYRRVPSPSTDFKLQPGGRLTYFSQALGESEAKFYALDASYAVVDSYATGNGYETDSHDLQILPDGHALLLSYDPEPVRMDLIVPGGRSNAVVIGLVVQELDAAKNVVFQWRSWDHFAITDATSPLAGLTSVVVDYVHGNSIELDTDGNLLLSCRHLCEVTKISRQTGDVLWRMGRHASQNQFTFVNDERGFSHQHDVRRLPNGHITLFDNGNLDTPLFSRALEYEVDEVAKRATLVWEYRHQPDVYGSFMGNVQRRADGGTMIGWGGTDGPKLTDLHADGTKAFELGMAGGTWTYRAFRFPWRTSRFVTDETALDFGAVRIGDPAQRTVTVRNPALEPITIDCAYTTNPAFTVEAALPASLAPGGSLAVEVRFDPLNAAGYAAKLYLRSTGEAELIAQDVELAGSGVTNRPPDTRGARAVPERLWPPNRQLEPVAIAGVTDPDGDPVTIEITSVTQDEAIAGADGCADAQLENQTAYLRADRDGFGNGRVYRIGFTARDPAGAATQGTVQVCVPHDQGGDPGANGTAEVAVTEGCEDEGQWVSSLGQCAQSKAAGDARATASGAARGAALPPGSVAIDFALPAAGDVTPAIFDLAGRRVVSLGRAWRQAGPQRIVWNAAGVPAGMYFCRIAAGPTVIMRPVMVWK
jgi:hypothetical protein